MFLLALGLMQFIIALLLLYGPKIKGWYVFHSHGWISQLGAGVYDLSLVLRPGIKGRYPIALLAFGPKINRCRSISGHRYPDAPPQKGGERGEVVYRLTNGRMAHVLTTSTSFCYMGQGGRGGRT